jgi:hypothetical protein
VCVCDNVSEERPRGLIVAGTWRCATTHHPHAHTHTRTATHR